MGSTRDWMSPHNKGSWFADVRFAWPTGYGWHKSFIFGLPEFDWFLRWEWIIEDSRWEAVDAVNQKRALVFRVALPTRTVKHVRSSRAYTWTPGSPTAPKRELLPRLRLRQGK